MIVVAGLGSEIVQSQSPLPQPEARLSPDPAVARDWADRLLADEAKVRATAEAALVQGAGRSLPLLRRFLAVDDESLHQQTFEIIRQIGPPAIPLLVELLRHEDASFRGFAADAFIDLAPDTQSIQPALRQALKDEDSMVAADAARALGALGERASPSLGALIEALSHAEPHVRIYAAEALATIGSKASAAVNDLARALSDPIPGVRWAAGEALAGIGHRDDHRQSGACARTAAVVRRRILLSGLL